MLFMVDLCACQCVLAVECLAFNKTVVLCLHSLSICDLTDDDMARLAAILPHLRQLDLLG